MAGTTVTNVADPSENTDKSGVNGTAFEFPVNTFPRLPEGEALVLTFTGRTDCGGKFGTPLATEVNSSAACSREFNSDLSRSDAIQVDAGPDLTPSFTLNVASTQVNCTSTEPLIITALNTGKAPSSQSEVCLILPPGIEITEDDITFLAPTGAEVENFSSTNLGTSGALQVCFDAPSTAIGGFFCLSLDISVDLECGPADIAVQVNRTQTLFCDGVACDVQIVDAPEQFIPLEVVPGLAIDEANVVAECSDEAGMINLGYSLALSNPGARYTGDVTIALFYDIDGSGEVEDSDPLIGEETIAVDLDAESELLLTGSLAASANEACPVLLRVTIPGCVCAEATFNLPDVLPDFVDDLGSDVVLCPGEDYVINGLCGEVTFELLPAESGSVVIVGDSLTLSLNPGFGVIGPVQLEIESRIGSCVESTSIVNVSAPLSFEFEDLSYDLCSVGCQEVDLGIDINLLEDLEVSISPTLYLDDPTSPSPIICDPQESTTYTVTYRLNDDCVTTSTFRVEVTDPPSATLRQRTACSVGFRVSEVLTVTPATLGGEYSTGGDGRFRPADGRGDLVTYLPGPQDIRAGEVQLTFRSDNPEGPCGGAVVRETFPILLVDCGQLPWDGER
ncbi:hypothetical protein [Lewinella sp. 4G2]|uniref:hypothetical protein n=1 Tax=Lewinella sp. 4G2 TaxID=1803372 RepID=UPI0007B46AD6|nr:hypothetical protein [Lewinella sp. 4G2]OAV44948.1 hypothetical protein A3850_010780 [Lewinella sp. 4G2]